MFSLRPVLFVWGWPLLYMVYANQIWPAVGFECPKVIYTMGTDRLTWIELPTNFNYEVKLNGEIHNLNWTTNPLIPGTQYNVTLVVTKTDSNGTQKPCPHEKPLWTKPAIPEGVTKSKVSERSETTPEKLDYLVTFKASKGNVSRYEMIIRDSGMCTFKEEDTTFLCSSLTPGKEYNYTITAYNLINDTGVFTGMFTTKAIAPSSVTNFSVIPSADNATVSWGSPKYQNGKISHYAMSVTARDGDYVCTSCFRCNSPGAADASEKGLMKGMANNSHDCSTVEPGSSCNQFSVQLLNLNPYAQYNISIYAVNEEGRGSGFNYTFMTEIGAANNVSNVTLTSKRNPTTGLVELDIEWTPGAPTGPTNYTITLEKKTQYNYRQFSNETFTVVNVTKYVVDNVKAFRQYRAHIVAATVKGESYSVSSKLHLTVESKPQLEKLFNSSTIIKKNEMARHTETEVSMTLCAHCLLNSSQGVIKIVNLLVCVKRDHKCNITEEPTKMYDTWKGARNSSFAQVYRTTPNNLVENLNRSIALGRNFTFTVGHSSNCENKDASMYCNGPLPKGQTVIIYVIVCTSVACDSVRSEDIVMSKHQKESNTSKVTAAVLSTMLATLVVCFVIFFIFRKKPAFLPFKRKPQEVAEISHNRPVKLRGFEDHVRKLHKDSNLLFQDEFEEIRNMCMTFKTSCNEAQREANRIKNRYVDILPYDHSRVKLDVQPEDDETNDFINANYIPGLNSVREYIATQGPMNCTVPDFWRMAWEQKCHIIVMLSDLQESGKLKVDQYWPESLNEPINFENVIVEVTNFSQLNKYIIRNFRITKGDETRKVIQFFLPGWWDFSANLNFDDVLEFVKVVRLAATPEASGPIIVHCSAGVGRTGTLIALDYFIQYVDKCSLDDDMDIFHYVLQMRKNRPRMVQAESQYIFIFDAMLEVIKKKIESEEGRQSQSYGSSKDGDIEQRDEAPIVSIHLVDEKYAFINKAFEPDDSKNIANLPEEEKSTSKPEDSKSAANLPTENSTTESDQS
jgi:protein-tyrosine phosphatase